MDVVELAARLIACPSVTPAAGPVFDVLEDALRTIGFAVDRFVAGEAPDGPVENLIAVRGDGGTHLSFAGHVDVVPPGDGWRDPPFAGTVRDGVLSGRGAVDMKGAVAAFVAAAATVPASAGTLSLLVTGDEEGPATFGTRAIIDRMRARRLTPDLCLVGEPTSQARVGDMVKVGRRGSVNIWIDVRGRQGHVAYPHLADNPIPRLVAALAAIVAEVLDEGTDWFQPSNIEITDLSVGNGATNVIPAAAAARLSIRFNDRHRGEALVERVRAIVHRFAPGASVVGRVSGEAFLTPPGRLSTLVADAIGRHTGLSPDLSTTGGTSDARFLSGLCPTVEFGLVNDTMHQVDEGVPTDDLRLLAAIYADIIRNALAKR